MLFTCVMTHLHRGAGWSCVMSGAIGSKQRRRETEGNCLFVLRLINKQSAVASSQSTRGSLLNITSIRKTLLIPAGETVWRYRRVFGVKHRIRHQIRSLSFWLTSVFYHSSPPSPPFFFAVKCFHSYSHCSSTSSSCFSCTMTDHTLTLCWNSFVTRVIQPGFRLNTGWKWDVQGADLSSLYRH